MTLAPASRHTVAAALSSNNALGASEATWRSLLSATVKHRHVKRIHQLTRRSQDLGKMCRWFRLRKHQCVGDFLPELERKPEKESADVEIAALSTSFHLNLKVFIICAWLQGGGGDQIRIWIISDFNRVGLRSPRRFYSTPGAAFQWSAVLYHFQNLTLSIFYISRCDKRPCLPLPLDLAYKEPAGCSCDWTKMTSSS